MVLVLMFGAIAVLAMCAWMFWIVSSNVLALNKAVFGREVLFLGRKRPNVTIGSHPADAD